MCISTCHTFRQDIYSIKLFFRFKRNYLQSSFKYFYTTNYVLWVRLNKISIPSTCGYDMLGIRVPHIWRHNDSISLTCKYQSNPLARLNKFTQYKSIVV